MTCSAGAALSAIGVPAAAQAVGPSAPTAAPAPPTITSTGRNVYVSGQATNYVGAPGVFTLSDPGSTVTEYNWGFGTLVAGQDVPANSNGTATLQITPNNSQVLQLYVAAVNADGESSPSVFQIETLTKGLGNAATLAWWKANAGHGTVAVDATGDGHGAALSAKGATLDCAPKPIPDGYRCTLKLAGGGAEATTPPALLPTVSSDSAFSVSAWVNVTKCASECAALSQDGSQVEGMGLNYQRSCTANAKTGPCWTFTMSSGPGTTQQTAASPPGSAHAGTWTQLTAVFDSTLQSMTLYVNGVATGQATMPPSIGGGVVRLGDSYPGGAAHSWTGRLSNMCAFYGALQPADVTLLYSGDSSHPRNGCAALYAKYP